jgi:hypothetical protein
MAVENTVFEQAVEVDTGIQENARYAQRNSDEVDLLITDMGHPVMWIL